MVVAIIMCYIKEVLTAEGGRGHATQHLAANGFCMGKHIREHAYYIINFKLLSLSAPSKERCVAKKQ